jgi:hypothetical protein
MSTGSIGEKRLTRSRAAVTLVPVASFVLALLLLRLTRGKPLRFAVLIEGKAVGEGPVLLAPGRALYLAETNGVFALLPRRSARSIVCFAAKGGKLALSVLKADRFPKWERLRLTRWAGRSHSDLNIDAAVQVKVVHRAAPIPAQHARGMGIVNHHDAPILFRQLDELRQGRNVPVHREDAVGDGQGPLAPGYVYQIGGATRHFHFSARRRQLIYAPTTSAGRSASPR